MSKTNTTEDRGAPWPLEAVAANIERLFTEAARHPVEPAMPVAEEAAQLMDEAFGVDLGS